jgi:hypothetical protein
MFASTVGLKIFYIRMRIAAVASVLMQAMPKVGRELARIVASLGVRASPAGWGELPA